MDSRLYKIGITLTPKKRVRLSGAPLSERLRTRLNKIFEAERARGVALALFDQRGISCATAGQARFSGNAPVRPDTPFRIASISKFVTAYGAMLLVKQGVLSLDGDISDILGFPVRNPAAKDEKITLKMLLSHTSSIKDGKTYNEAIVSKAPLEKVLSGDSFSAFKPGAQWDYSNLGAGIIGCVMEKAAGEPFDLLMRRLVFDPLNISASYAPSRAKPTLADAWRLFPPARTPNFNAQARLAQPKPNDVMDVSHDYLMAHGSLCIAAPDLANIARAVAANAEIFEQMRAVILPFGERDRTLKQGLGTFIYQEPSMKTPLFGHQGLAYGAVHGLFMDEKGRGFVVLTSAVSEKRQGVLTRMNRALCEALLSEGVWSE